MIPFYGPTKGSDETGSDIKAKAAPRIVWVLSPGYTASAIQMANRRSVLGGFRVAELLSRIANEMVHSLGN